MALGTKSQARVPIFLWLLLVALAVSLALTEAAIAQWCVADPQAPDYVLQGALDWACGAGGADCSSIQVNQQCFWPDTLLAHASIAFNNYWQKFKHQGASCYFNAAALITENNPSHDACQYMNIP
eukprot:Gb_14999 [translate_table: standard]